MQFWPVLFLAAAATAFGASPSRERIDDSAALVNQLQAEEWLRVWQKRLSLEDWKVELRIVRSWELKPDTLGNLRWNSTARTATIRVLDPVDYDLPLAKIPRDIEMTIVHELLHLQLSVLPKDSSKKADEERVVTRIAEALMNLDNERRPAPATLSRMGAEAGQ